MKRKNGTWLSAADDPRLVTAGFLELTAIGKRRAELRALDARLRLQQTRTQRLELYREIIQRGDIGNGYSITFTDDTQAQEYHCEELAILGPDAKRGRKVIEAAAQGGRARASEHFATKRTDIRAALKRYLSENPKVSLTAARKRVADKLSVSPRTVLRHTKGPS